LGTTDWMTSPSPRPHAPGARAIRAALSVCLGVLSLASSAESPWGALLAAANLTPQTAQLDPNRWTGGGEHRLAEFQRLWDDWQLVDPTAQSWAQSTLAAPGSFVRLAAFSAPKIGVDLPPDPRPAPPRRALGPSKARAALVAAIADLHAAFGPALDASRMADLRARATRVPASVAQAAAIVLRAVPDALAKRRKALEAFGGEAEGPAAFQAALKLAQQTDVDDAVLRLMDKIDLASLLGGGLDLAAAVDRATSVGGRWPQREFALGWDTPLGQIVLNGSQANTYAPGAYLLAIDTGGNDRYEAGVACTSPATPVSIAVDGGGNDVYEAKDGFAAAAGVLGYAFLLDCGGDDAYEAAGGLGTGIFGVGMLIDQAGKDTYRGRQLAEGAGVFGLGALSDTSGDDTYRCLTQSQAYAGPKGLGLLVDCQGNDDYVADDTNIVNPSPQTAEHNVSLAQGCGFGRRAHPGDGHSLAGGIGLLVDVAGNDRYHCGVFGQGVAYWYAMGLLVDLAGNDTYEGVWYVQGSAAHYAVAGLCDLAGDDTYRATMTQSQGAGHDYSLGVLHDVAGDDVYECPGGAVGFGIWNGIGIFRDSAGNDSYKTGPSSLGSVGDCRPESSCLGLLLDEGGNDTFPPDSMAKPHSVWVRPVPDGRPLARGAGAQRQ